MSLIKFPGLIDVHVHLREPGATHKEDFHTGSKAAIKGGFTYILDMPNNPIPTLSLAHLHEKISLSQNATCNIGFHFGTDGHNLNEFPKAANHPQVFGLKIYCNHTTGTLLIEDQQLLENIFQTWPSHKPILVHAEGQQLEMALQLARIYKKRLHICHISQKTEVELVRAAKKAHLPVSVGVTPHHLFLTRRSTKKLQGFGIMKPPLSTKEDRDALWEGIADGTIDLIETDHAPHTQEEKSGKNPAFGVPGLETALGLLLKAVHEKRLTLTKVQTLLHKTPKHIFNTPNQPNTYIEFDPSVPYILTNSSLSTKCGWSPFNGWQLYGQVQTVVINNQPKLIGGKIIGN